MGSVWLAQHIALDIPCAVKFIHDEAAENAEVRARFEREAKAAAQLRSTNVVQILDYGLYDDTPYIAMEHLQGEPLSARLAQRVRLEPHEAFRIIAQVGKALTKAHAAGIVHRDLKPENVFLVVDEEEGEIAKVLDFGVAKQTIGLADSQTKTGALLGTPFFMSPEQAQGIKAVDSRTDLWALAVLAFRCITGELPFQSQALGDLLIKIVTHPLPVPSQVAPGLPEGFDGWWQKAAERDPDARYQSARELVEALGVALGVTIPSNLAGNTPMPMNLPAASVDPSALAAAPAPETAGETAPGQAAPYGGGPPRPATLAMGPAAPVPGLSGTAPGGGPSAAVEGSPQGRALGDSGTTGSVAGVYAPAQQRGSGMRVAVAVLAIGGLVAGAAGAAFVMWGGGSGAEESTSECVGAGGGAATTSASAASTTLAAESAAPTTLTPESAVTSDSELAGAGGQDAGQGGAPPSAATDTATVPPRSEPPPATSTRAQTAPQSKSQTKSQTKPSRTSPPTPTDPVGF